MRDIYEQGTPTKKLQTGNLRGCLCGEGGHDNTEDEVDRKGNFVKLCIVFLTIRIT